MIWKRINRFAGSLYRYLYYVFAVNEKREVSDDDGNIASFLSSSQTGGFYGVFSVRGFG